MARSMKLKIMIWTILGFSVGIVAFFCIAVAETFVGKPIFEDHRLYIAGIFAAAGVAAWFVGRYLGAKRHVAEDEEGEEPRITSRFVLFDLRYWGPMCLAFGIIVLFIRPLKAQKNEAVVPPRSPKAEPVAVVEAPEPAKPKVPVTFPPLKIQGIIYREAQPFAIINGYSYTIGDQVGGVMVRAIDRSSVVLELAGEMKLLTLR